MSTWSGQFEYLERAEARLKVVVPVTLLIIFLLLYLNFRALTETLIVMLSLPFALVGGLWLLWWLSFNLSVAVAVGFIALAGVAAETGVVMLIYLDHALGGVKARVQAEGRGLTRADLTQAIMVGAVERVRPENDDRGRHHGRAFADLVEHRYRLGGDAAHRGADDRRDGLFDVADAGRDPGAVRDHQGLGFARGAGAAGRPGCLTRLEAVSGSRGFAGDTIVSVYIEGGLQERAG